ncbi:hypothetical protein [Roseobacter denitrificans]|nr:hypothetical protein [Roseobacter denitrificans]SFG26452.1 hypothetical protein SAMN05443635_11173 [Roseobacter denitrificans OCh 114]
MTIELFAIGSSGLALVVVMLMVATRSDVPVASDAKKPETRNGSN